MDDTISRLAVIQIIEKMRARIGHNIERSVGRAMIEILDEVGEDVEKLPSAQPDIIRCKDCKHFAGEGMYCSCDIIVQFDHFYCYHAERRQDV